MLAPRPADRFRRPAAGRRSRAGPSLARATLLLALAGGAPCASAGTWIDLGGPPASVTILAPQDALDSAAGARSDPRAVVLEIAIGGFEVSPVDIRGATYQRIRLPGEAVSQAPGEPELPSVRRSLIIPDEGGMSVRLLASEYRDLPGMPIAPSRGALPRSVDPRAVPYEFADAYRSADPCPAAPVEGGPPYILRDFRGMVVSANPFQYFPATQTLRVHTRMLVEVTPEDSPSPARPSAADAAANPLHRPHPLGALDREFARFYAGHFLNFERQRYELRPDEGELLILTADALRPWVEPLYRWKLQKGTPVRIASLSEVGATPQSIRDFIRAQYETTDLSHVLLVGDGAQMPTFLVSGGGADPQYALLAGDDPYPEIFVGRFSAETAADVTTQVERTIAYERDARADEIWPQHGTGIASDAGPGHYDEYDDEHIEYIRQDLLNYGYAAVDSLYEPWVEGGMIADALNEGRGIVNYAGHGAVIGWATGGFDTSYVNALENVGRLPFIHSVACRNGKFEDRTCFAEVWLRATHDGRPAGATATYMSSIIQYWDPPMTAQDEAADLLVADAMRTVGGLWFNGSSRMIDDHGERGAEMFLTWVLFGDPSLAIRTRVAAPLAVSHRDTLFFGETEYAVTIPGVPDALCALYAEGICYGAARTDSAGAALITLGASPTEPVPLCLTVTAYNHATCLDTVLVIPTEGPCLAVADAEFSDGNGDAILNAGEDDALRLLVRNDGLDPATGVSAVLHASSPFVTLTVDRQAYGDLPSGGEVWSPGDYVFTVAPDCPDSHVVVLAVDFTTDQGPLWGTAVEFVVRAPEIAIAAYAVADSSGGDGNLTLDPGEWGTVRVTLANAGSYALDDLTATLLCNHPLIDVVAGVGVHPGIAPGASGEPAPPYELHIDLAYPLSRASCELEIAGANGYARILTLALPVGEFYDDVEAGPGLWTHRPISAGFGDQWHVSDDRNHTPGGDHSWKCGSATIGSYATYLDAGLETPPLEIGPGAVLAFWMRIEAETALTYPDSAYDGGLVELSIDGGPFAQVSPVGGYPYLVKTRPGAQAGPFPLGTPVFGGNRDWRRYTFELGDVHGVARLRFRFGSDGTSNREGWYVDDIEVIGLGDASGAPDDPRPDAALTRMALAQNRPNPFTSGTRISFALPRAGGAEVRIFDPAGRVVRTLHEGPLGAGAHTLVWDGASDGGQRQASGVYYYRLNTASGSLERSLILVR